MIEDRLRTTLAELADGVPASEHPRTELDRRLAKHKPARRLVLAAAAAAVLVIAGVAVPMMLDGTPPASRPAAPDVVEEDLGHHVLGTFTENGTTYQAVAWTEGAMLCVGRTATGAPEFGDCEPVTWPTRETNAVVTSRTVLSAGMPDSGPLPHLLLFLTAPEVATLHVEAAYGTPVDLRELERTGMFTLYVADFGGSSQGFGYTAKNASGTVLEQAIT